MNIFPLTYAIILNYNSSNESIALFRNLEKLGEKSLVVLVIDNASPEEDRQLLKKAIPESNLILNNTNKGYAAGNNAGVNIALQKKADYIWILNPDIRADEKALKILIDTLTKDHQLAAVGPRIVHRHKPGFIFSDGEIMDRALCKTSHKNHNLPVAKVPSKLDYAIDYIDGSSILLNSKAVEEIGNLPEEYFLYFEETDWCFKAREMGWKLAVNSNAVVYNVTSDKKSIFHYYMSRNRLIFSKKYLANYRKIRKYYATIVIKELMDRLKGKFLKPYFFSRLKGIFSGIIKTAF